MKNPYEVLNQKEVDLARVRREIDSLKMAISLLAQDPTDQQPTAEQSRTDEHLTTDHDPNSDEEVRPPLEDEETDLPLEARPTGTDGLFSSIGGSHSRVWKIFRREK
jgi:hypothetical protein